MRVKFSTGLWGHVDTILYFYIRNSDLKINRKPVGNLIYLITTKYNNEQKRREVPISMSLSRVFYTFPGKQEMGIFMHCYTDLDYMNNNLYTVVFGVSIILKPNYDITLLYRHILD